VSRVSQLCIEVCITKTAT